MSAPSPPFYFIYGEELREVDPRFVHVERVSDRKFLHGGSVQAHRHPHLHQLSYWVRGEGVYSVGNMAKHAIEPGTLTWMPTGTVHGFTVTPDSDAIVLSVSNDFLSETLTGLDSTPIGAILDQPVVMAVREDVRKRLNDLFLDLEREYLFPSWAQADVISAAARLILITLARLRNATAGEQMPSRPLFVQFLAALNRNFKTHRTIEVYAGLLNTTPYLLNRACREGSGKRALDLIRARVMQEAKRLLLFTALDIGEIAYTLGYDDPAHFTRMFRQASGRAPREWRNDQRTKMLAAPAATG